MWSIAIPLGIVAALGARILWVARDRRRTVAEFEGVADSIYADVAMRPAIEFRYSYGYPNFQVTFRTDADLAHADTAGQNTAFRQAVQRRFQRAGSKSNPFEASKAIWFTSTQQLNNIKQRTIP